MTPLEAEAMLVRQSAAVTCLDRSDEQDRWELLAAVVSPGEEALAASLAVAEARGVSRLAQDMVKTHARRLGAPVVSNPRRRAWMKV